MLVSHISVGGGITGLETIISTFSNIEKKLKKSKKKCAKLRYKKFIFAKVDKKPENIPGGVAYGYQNSKYGYFNNPIRLSPPSFVKWIMKKKNKNALIQYLDLHGGLTGKDWIRKNKGSARFKAIIRRAMKPYLAKLNKDMDQTFIVITHNNTLAELASRKLEIHDGKII